MRKYEAQLRKIDIIFFALSGWIFAILNILISDHRVDMLGITFGNDFLFFFGAVGISVSLLEVMKNKTYQLYLLKPTYEMVSQLGKRSLIVMALHLKVMTYVMKFLFSIGFYTGWVCAIFTLASTYLLAKVIERFMPWLYKYPNLKNDKRI